MNSSGDHKGWMVTLVQVTDPPSVLHKGPFLSEQVAKDLVKQQTENGGLGFHREILIPHSMYKQMKQLGMK